MVARSLAMRNRRAKPVLGQEREPSVKLDRIAK